MKRFVLRAGRSLACKPLCLIEKNQTDIQNIDRKNEK